MGLRSSSPVSGGHEECARVGGVHEWGTSSRRPWVDGLGHLGPRRPCWVREWAAGEAGTGTVRRSYAFVLKDRYLHEKNLSTYPPQVANKAGEVHEHWSFFSYDRQRNSRDSRAAHPQPIPGVGRTCRGERMADGRCRMVAGAALTLGLLLLGDRAGSPRQGPEAAADSKAADVVWSYDTGG
jgi:hypothetical protein